MNHIKQAEILKSAIRRARLSLVSDCEQVIADDELKYRYDAILGMLTIAGQEMSALMANWASNTKDACDVHFGEWEQGCECCEQVCLKATGMSVTAWLRIANGPGMIKIGPLCG